MGFLYDTLDEYETEITFVREQIQNAVKSTDFLLDTSQSRQRVTMNLKEIRLYLTQLTTEKQAFIQQSLGAGVTSLTYRRC